MQKNKTGRGNFAPELETNSIYHPVSVLGFWLMISNSRVLVTTMKLLVFLLASEMCRRHTRHTHTHLVLNTPARSL